MKKLLFLLSLFFISNTVFSQTENYWIRKTDFGGLKRERAVAFTINGKGYVGTGVDTAEAVKKDFWAYDPSMDSWTQVADFGGVPRRNAIAFSANNQGYVGTGMSDAVSTMGTPLADIWSYNALTNTWIQKSSYPGNIGLGIYFATAFSVNGKGYICGGKKGPANYSDELWEYKPSTDTWSMLQAFPGGVRYQLASFVVDNKAYVGLGVDLDIFRKDIWEFDPSTNLWTQKNDFLGSERGAVSTFAFNYRGFICLGGDGGYKKDVWEYNPYDDSWSIRADFGGSARKNAFSFVINDTAYVGCGKGISGKKMSFYAYVPYKSALSLNDFKNIELSTYPNPINDILTIKINTANIHSIAIYDMVGKEVYTTVINSDQLSINRTNISSGTYLLVAKNTFGQPITSKKLIFN
jgi:N-acetylneuraminic acid mutarotase